MEHLMWMRNSPKVHMARLIADIGSVLRPLGERFAEAGRLDAKGDIFHLHLEEAERARKDSSYDIRSIVAPRKQNHARWERAPLCPVLIDSRNRILKPNVVKGEPGTLVGHALSPGVATGRVRIINSPTERLFPGEVLAAVVTDPAWTPLFVGASAVVFQIGGALQHGALCAREYGKPGVSGIDIHTDLKTGMLVTVDGNTGIVKIHEEASP